MNGIIREILISGAAGEPLRAIDNALLVAGRGIEGDRYFDSRGTFSESLKEKGDFEVTLIEFEEIEAFNRLASLNYSNAMFRRNIVTSGIRLNQLVGGEFSIGSTRLRAVRLCEPCSYLADLLGQEVMKYMLHKAGIRAVISIGGSIAVGSTITAI